MTKKPTKKHWHYLDGTPSLFWRGYNQACVEWEAWLKEQEKHNKRNGKREV